MTLWPGRMKYIGEFFLSFGFCAGMRGSDTREPGIEIFRETVHLP